MGSSHHVESGQDDRLHQERTVGFIAQVYPLCVRLLTRKMAPHYARQRAAFRWLRRQARRPEAGAWGNGPGSEFTPAPAHCELGKVVGSALDLSGLLHPNRAHLRQDSSGLGVWDGIQYGHSVEVDYLCHFVHDARFGHMLPVG